MFLQSLDLGHYFRQSKMLIGVLIVVSVIGMAILAPVLSPHDPNSLSLRARLTPPVWNSGGSSEYLLGTDQLGRDLLSRIVFGARTSLIVGFLSVLTSGVLGTTLGLVAGHYGGWVDTIVMRVTDVIMALPFMLVALIVVALLGPSIRNIVVVFAVTAWPVYTKLTRASMLSVRENQYVEAARAIGVQDIRIMLRHMLPNVFSPLLVMISFEVARIITTEAGLGFLGLGCRLLIPPGETC